MSKINFDISPSGPYFSVLRAAIWERPVDISAWPKTVNWNPIIENFRLQEMLPLVSDALLRLPEPYSLSHDQRNRILAHVAQNVRAHYNIRKVYKKLSVTLESNNIHPILLKGEELASLYPIPDTRACGDIDIYLGSDARQATHLLMQLGARFIGNDGRHYEIVLDDVVIELHYHLRHGGKYLAVKQKWEEENYIARIIGSCSDYPQQCLKTELLARCLSPTLELVFDFAHLTGHLNGLVGLRQFVDLALVVTSYNDKINAQCFCDFTVQFRWEKQWEMCAIILSRYLGVDQKIIRSLSQSKIPNVRNDYAKEFVLMGNFGQANKLKKKSGFIGPVLSIWNRRFQIARNPESFLRLVRNKIIQHEGND